MRETNLYQAKNKFSKAFPIAVIILFIIIVLYTIYAIVISPIIYEKEYNKENLKINLVSSRIKDIALDDGATKYQIVFVVNATNNLGKNGVDFEVSKLKVEFYNLQREKQFLTFSLFDETQTTLVEYNATKEFLIVSQYFYNKDTLSSNDDTIFYVTYFDIKQSSYSASGE